MTTLSQQRAEALDDDIWGGSPATYHLAWYDSAGNEADAIAFPGYTRTLLTVATDMTAASIVSSAVRRTNAVAILTAINTDPTDDWAELHFVAVCAAGTAQVDDQVSGLYVIGGDTPTPLVVSPDHRGSLAVGEFLVEVPFSQGTYT